MSTQSRVTVRVSRVFAFSPEEVFDAWLDPKSAGKWLFATPTGHVTRVAIDPRIGGSFTIVDRRDGEDVEHTGEYLAIDRPRRLVFDFWVPKYTTEKTRVTVDIAPREGGSEVTLSHENVYADFATKTQSGWTMILDALDAALRTH